MLLSCCSSSIFSTLFSEVFVSSLSKITSLFSTTPEFISSLFGVTGDTEFTTTSLLLLPISGATSVLFSTILSLLLTSVLSSMILSLLLSTSGATSVLSSTILSLLLSTSGATSALSSMILSLLLSTSVLSSTILSLLLSTSGVTSGTSNFSTTCCNQE